MGWSRRTLLVVTLVVFWTVGSIAAASATAEGGDDPAGEQLRAGQAVYEANCVACHQADGRGIPGSFPPLVDNSRIDDADYVGTVIRNGLTGEIEVNGEIYNSAMPAFQLLDDEQVAAVTAYLQNDLVAPAAPGGAAQPENVAGTELPLAVTVTYALGFLAFLVVAGLVAAPYLMAKGDNHYYDWPRAWLKAIVIFLFFTVATVILPSFLMEWGPVSRSDRIIQDLIGSGVWFVALVLGLWGLRRGQRERII